MFSELNKLIQIVDYVTEPNAEFPCTNTSNRVVFIIPTATVKQCEMKKKIIENLYFDLFAEIKMLRQQMKKLKGANRFKAEFVKWGHGESDDSVQDTR